MNSIVETKKASHEAFEQDTLSIINKLEIKKKTLEVGLVQVNAQISALRTAIGYAKTMGNVPKKQKQQAWADVKLSAERRKMLVAYLMDNDDEISKRSIGIRFPQWSDSACTVAIREARNENMVEYVRTGDRRMKLYRSILRSVSSQVQQGNTWASAPPLVNA